MDLDKPLEDLIADKRKSSRSDRPDRPRAPRQSSERAPRAAAPYTRPPPRSTEDTWVHDAYQGPGAGRRNDRAVAAVAGTGAAFTGVSPRIEVVGLHYEVTPADLKNIFSQAGTLVQGPTIRYDRSGRSTGLATMEYASYQQAKIAINKFDGAMTKGQTISIRLLPPITARGPPATAAAAQTGGSLLSRISGGAKDAPAATAVQGGRGGARGAVRGRGPVTPARGGRGGARRGPANAGDLDKELDSFMAVEKTADVEMA